MRSKGRSHEVGSLRPSQFLFFGEIGAVDDLPAISVMVMGRDDWNRDDSAEISEPKLLQVLQAGRGSRLTSLRARPTLISWRAGGRKMSGWVIRSSRFRIGWFVPTAECCCRSR